MALWLLPEYFSDILPQEARHLERLRRRLLDFVQHHGYQLVIPPLIEHLNSLLTGAGSDLDLRTFKLVDQLSGRLLGVRADITPQATRIDAHLLNDEGVVRLCYCGSVVHAMPAHQLASRELLQFGAELYGYSGIDGDLEIQRLALDALAEAGVTAAQMDVGHVGIFRALVALSGFDDTRAAELLTALRAKERPGLINLVAGLDSSLRRAWLELPELYGGRETLDAAARVLPDDVRVRAALSDLATVAAAHPLGAVSFDLGDLRGYNYHNGLVFSIYTAGATNAVVLGGRYDEVGEAFGRARPATGFSLDLRELAWVVARDDSVLPVVVRVDELDDLGRAEVARLRAAGEVVIVSLRGETTLGPVRRLIRRGGEWAIDS
jgi:ATP phosphoribosyltransferase regulatory subunit